MIGFLIFSYTDASAGLSCLGAMFGVGVQGFSSPVATYQLLRSLPLLVLAAVGATPLPRRLWERLRARHSWSAVLVPLLCACVILLSTAYLVDSTFSPFAYTQF